jgi:hypothetical protein
VFEARQKVSTAQVLIKEDSIAIIGSLPLSPFSGVSPGIMTSTMLSPQVEYPRISSFLEYEAGRKFDVNSKVAYRKQMQMFWGGFATEKPKGQRRSGNGRLACKI